MSKIALFGGTFNPVHNAHIHFCEECDKQIKFDKIILIPTKQPVHKTSHDLASDKDRLNMLNLSIEGKEKFSVSEIEINSTKRNYTVYTINQLNEKYPDDELYFLMGSDMFLIFDKWKNYEEILKKATVVAGARNKTDYLKLIVAKEKFSGYEDKIIILDIDILDLSSTQVREQANIDNGQALKGMVSDSVNNYIIENQLYCK